MTPRGLAFVAASLLGALLSGCGDSGAAPDGGGDENGKMGGSFVFEVTVTDATFAPSILESENDARIRLTLTNHGTTPHDLFVERMPMAIVNNVAPGEQLTVTFDTPNREGIYAFHSNGPGGAPSGQFIVQ